MWGFFCPISGGGGFCCLSVNTLESNEDFLPISRLLISHSKNNPELEVLLKNLLKKWKHKRIHLQQNLLFVHHNYVAYDMNEYMMSQYAHNKKESMIHRLDKLNLSPVTVLTYDYDPTASVYVGRSTYREWCKIQARCRIFFLCVGQ